MKKAISKYRIYSLSMVLGKLTLFDSYFLFQGDCKGAWKCMWSGKPLIVGHQPRQFGPPIEPPLFAVNQIRIFFDGSLLTYHQAVDSVCLLVS